MSLKLYGRNKYFEIKRSMFSGGEEFIQILDVAQLSLCGSMTIELYYESSSDLIALSLLVDSIRRIVPYSKIHLFCPYFPYARQDRVTVEGESASLQVIAGIISGLRFRSIKVLDAHSYVLENLFHQAFWKQQYSMTSGQVVLSP